MNLSILTSGDLKFSEKLANLLPDEKRAASSGTIAVKRQPFQVAYRLNCENLCADFDEDLQFQFSWGLTAMLQRFQGKNYNRFAIKQHGSNQMVVFE